MRRTLVSIAGCLLLAGTVPAVAQDSLEEARARREAVQAEAARAAGEIDVLRAEDAEIVAALDQLDDWIAAQTARLDRAEQDLAATLEAEAEARDIAGQLTLEIQTLRDRIKEQSVTTYIQGFTAEDELLLSADDINSVPMLRFVLDEASGVSADTTDLLRVAVDHQQRAISDAEAAAEEARRIQVEIQANIDELEASRIAQERLQAEVQRRIDELENETEILAAESAQIEQFIQDEIARLAAEEERRRREEAERRAEAERQAEAERRAEEAAAAEEAAEQEAAEDDSPGGDQTVTDASSDTETATEPEPEPEPRPDADAAPSFRRPVPGAITSGYGNRIHPVYGTRRLHTGIDFNGAHGSPIGAAANGTVIFAGSFAGYGNTVILQHTGGYTSLYAHMSGFNVSEGASVRAGATIGFIGSTGLSTGPHLHFEIRLNGGAIDPAPFL